MAAKQDAQVHSTDIDMSEPVLSNEPRPLAAEGGSTARSVEIGILRTLSTDYGSIYVHSSKNTAYISPDSLRGVPITKIEENSSYWEPSWDSLDAFIAHEAEEESLKEKYQAMRDAEPNNEAIRKRAKFHQDNMSKQVKIREVFGAHSSYHPNQLVAKQHMPYNGLCQKELMYRVACKISDLKVLNDQGVLTMDGWDFIRWRIGVKLAERLNHPGQNGKGFVRTIIYKLCDEARDSCTGYEDPVMRQAVILSAQYQGRLASFKIDGSKHGGSGAKRVNIATKSKDAHRANKKICRNQIPAGTANTARRNEERQRRRAQLASQLGSYQGVNAFRRAKQERSAEQ